jgi:pyruvate/2-oxoglutarate dehydrogenase complex dihydrolipoamide dehydrogenase (E3) component
MPECRLSSEQELIHSAKVKSLAARASAFGLETTSIGTDMRLSEPRGFMKMLIDEGSDRILGFTVFGTEASELMATAQTAMLGALPYTALRDELFTHPTAAEGLTILLANVTTGRSAKHTEGRPT